MNQYELTITSTRPFSDGKFLNFNANTPGGPIEGVVWEASVAQSFQPGAQISITVGANRESGAFFKEYKGKSRLEINKAAQFQVLSGGAPAATPAPAPTPTAAPAPAASPYGFNQPAAAPQPAPAAPAPAPTTPTPQAAPAPQNPSGGSGEEVIDRVVQLTIKMKNDLQNAGFSPEGAERAAAQAGTIVSSWWFGEKTC